MRFHVRVHWSKEDDWSGWYEATTPGEALARAARAIAKKAGVDERLIEVKAQFTVGSEGSLHENAVREHQDNAEQHKDQPDG